MEPSLESPLHSPGLLAAETPPPAGLCWGRLLIWLPACALQGALIAWIAIMAQQYSAPLGIFSLLVGVGLGATTVAMTRVGQVGHRGTIVLGLLLAVLLAVVGQHYLRYRMDVDQAQKDAQTLGKARQLFGDRVQGEVDVPSGFLDYLRWQAARGRPLHVAGYVARGPVAWLSWAIDALLVLLAAVAMVLPAIRQPYCNGCRSWYRTVRSGRLSADNGRRLASLVGVAMPEGPSWVRYRLLDCNNGCGPTRLQLAWEDADNGPVAHRFWLSAQGRNRVTQMLDQARMRDPQPPLSANGPDSTCDEPPG